MDVEVVRWPTDAARREVLAAATIPRLLLVARGEPPPIVSDELEDWVRAPAAPEEVDARLRTLALRAAALGRIRPELLDGLLTYRSASVPLGPVEAMLARRLVDRFRSVVPRESLARAAWPDGLQARNRLDVHVLRLRRRVAPLGLVITTVRRRGYMLDAATFAALGAWDGRQRAELAGTP